MRDSDAKLSGYRGEFTQPSLCLDLHACTLSHSYKQSLRRSAPVKIIEAPVRTYIPTSLPPGSVRAGPVAGNAPSIAGSDGRILYDWQGGHSIDT